MPFTPSDRKTRMKAIGLTQQQVADACDTDQALVARILMGRQWGGSAGRRVMVYIAKRLGHPLLEVFPFAERRKKKVA